MTRPTMSLLRTGSALVALSIAGAAMAADKPAAPAATAAGQPQPDPQTNAATGEDQQTITVTARRRNENIVDVPLAVTVVTGAQIDKLGITSTNQLANFTPGLEFSDFTPGNSRNDRGGNRLLIFRGLNLSNNGGVTGAGSMFLDGAAVIGNEIPAGLDIGAVEVLRGPQNVYFGRASMAGAVSYRTKTIPLDHWTGEIDLSAAERKTYHAEATVAGPLIPDVLGIRLTGLAEGNDGYICNQWDGCATKLGARSRKSISGAVEFKPADALEIKLYGNYFHDADGMAATVNIFPDARYSPGGAGNPPAGTVVALGTVTNCLRGVNATGAGGAVLPARATICGRVPGPQYAINYSNLIIPQRDAAVLFNVPILQGQGFSPDPGLQRNATNTHAVVNLQLSSYLKLQSITGYHQNAVQQAGDGIQQPVKPGATYSNYDYNLVNKFRDISQELRLSSNPDLPFSWTVGANYVNAQNLSTAIVTFTSNPATGTPTFTPFAQNIGDDRARTYGFFAGAYLKLLDNKLTLSAEGRYQIDNRETITYNSAYVFLTDPGKRNFRSFNPRVSIDYDVGGHRKIYASYAEGSRPGGFNSGLLVYLDPNNAIYTRTSPPPLSYATVSADINNTFGPVGLTYDEEKLRIGELGFKGDFAHGSGYFDINAYYGVLSNQQIRRSLVVASLGFSLGAVQNTGKVQIYGIEVAGNYNFTRQISLSTTFAWNHTKRLTYIDNSPATLQLYGFGNFAGLKLPNTPEISGSAVLSYDDIQGDSWTPFGNVAFVYRGKQYADLGNFAYIPGRATVDLRLGVQNDKLKVEAFATNLFNNLTYPGGNVAPDFGGNQVGGVSSQYSGFFGAYAIPRTVGGRITAKF